MVEIDPWFIISFSENRLYTISYGASLESINFRKYPLGTAGSTLPIDFDWLGHQTVTKKFHFE
jgi:hypothetical protein